MTNLKRKLTKLYFTQNADALVVNCLPNLGGGGFRTANMNVLWWVHELHLAPEWVFKRLIKNVQRNASKILCVSSPVQNLFKEKACLFPNAVLIPENRVLQNPFSKKSLELMWVGTVSPRKGLHMLKPLISGLQEDWPEIDLYVYGSTTSKYSEYYSMSLNPLVELGIKVHRFDNIPDDEVPWSSSRILLQTSVLPESFSLPVMEAMSHGMLVICSELGGVQDFGRHHENLMFLQKLTGTLAENLLRLKDDPKGLAKIQNQARETARDFSVARMTESFNKLLDG